MDELDCNKIVRDFSLSRLKIDPDSPYRLVFDANHHLESLNEPLFITPSKNLIPVEVDHVKVFQHWEVKTKMEEVIAAQKVLHESVVNVDSFLFSEESIDNYDNSPTSTSTSTTTTSTSTTEEVNYRKTRDVLLLLNDDDNRFDTIRIKKQSSFELAGSNKYNNNYKNKK